MARISGFLAGELALIAFTGLISRALRPSSLSLSARNWLGNACLIGFVFSTPILFLLGNLSIYSEPILWGLAWSLASLFFAWRIQEATGRALTIRPFGFSFSAGAALLSRVTYGGPLLLIALFVTTTRWLSVTLRSSILFDFCFVLFLSVGGTSLIRTRYLLMSLILISAVVNSLATDSWLAADRNLPAETQHFWNSLAIHNTPLLK